MVQDDSKSERMETAGKRFRRSSGERIGSPGTGRKASGEPADPQHPNASVRHPGERHPAGSRAETRRRAFLDFLPDPVFVCNMDNTVNTKADQTNQALYRIARALYRFPRLDRMLDYITCQVRELIGVGGAAVILIDEEKGEFHIPVATYEDGLTGRKMKEIRFPMDKGIAGYVYRTGRPLIVPDTTQNPHFYDQVDKLSQYRHKNMLDVPLRIKNRMIGVLNAVNKKEGVFDQADVELLSAVANLVALPIENARINEALQQAYDNARELNRAKAQVIHQLSHELKTPLSVLSASMVLLERRLPRNSDAAVDRIMARVRRNLKRLLDMQYAIGDMLREQDYQAPGMLSFFMDGGRDGSHGRAGGPRHGDHGIKDATQDH